MAQPSQIEIPTPIGSITLTIDEIFSFSPDERGGVVIILKEKAGNIHLEIISGYSHQAFSEWYEANKG
jgi:hypothetical protein